MLRAPERVMIAGDARLGSGHKLESRGNLLLLVTPVTTSKPTPLRPRRPDGALVEDPPLSDVTRSLTPAPGDISFHPDEVMDASSPSRTAPAPRKAV